MSLIVGIDPGLSGALAFFDGFKVDCVIDMPTRPRAKGKGNEVDAGCIASIFRDDKVIHAFIEYVNAAPIQGRRQGAQSMFNFGEGYGIIKAVLETLAIPYIVVAPADWKAYHGLLRKDKGVSCTLVAQRYPEIADRMIGPKGAKKDGRGDAVLIGEYGIKRMFT